MNPFAPAGGAAPNMFSTPQVTGSPFQAGAFTQPNMGGQALRQPTSPFVGGGGVAAAGQTNPFGQPTALGAGISGIGGMSSVTNNLFGAGQQQQHQQNPFGGQQQQQHQQANMFSAATGLGGNPVGGTSSPFAGAQPQQQANPFASPAQPQQQANPFANVTAFGGQQQQQTLNVGFVQQQQQRLGGTTSPFAAQQQQMGQQRGSAQVPFNPVKLKDKTTDSRGHTTEKIVTLQHISGMDAYKTKSADEIRFEDYQIGNRTGQPGQQQTQQMFQPAGNAFTSPGQNPATTNNIFGSSPQSNNPFGAPSGGAANLFGGPVGSASAANPFGAPPGGMNPANPFGAPAGGASANPFGAPASGVNAANPFGAPAGGMNAANPFGAPTGGASANPFGAPAGGASAANPFGAPAGGMNAANPFGAPAGGASAGNPFGAPAGGASAANPFGAPVGGASAANPFGAPAGGASAANPFAAPAGGASAANPFGAPAGGASAANPFGAPAGGASAANPFAAPTGSASAANPFAAPAGGASAANPFAAPTGSASAANPFAAPAGGASAANPFAVPASGASAANPFAVPAGGASAANPFGAPATAQQQATTHQNALLQQQQFAQQQLVQQQLALVAPPTIAQKMEFLISKKGELGGATTTGKGSESNSRSSSSSSNNNYRNTSKNLFEGFSSGASGVNSPSVVTYRSTARAVPRGVNMFSPTGSRGSPASTSFSSPTASSATNTPNTMRYRGGSSGGPGAADGERSAMQSMDKQQITRNAKRLVLPNYAISIQTPGSGSVSREGDQYTGYTSATPGSAAAATTAATSASANSGSPSFYVHRTNGGVPTPMHIPNTPPLHEYSQTADLLTSPSASSIKYPATGSRSSGEEKGVDPPSRDVVDRRSPSSSNSSLAIPPLCTRPGYFTSPSMDVLERMSQSELRCVRDFTVCRTNMGSIRWEGTTDVRGLDIDNIVNIKSQEVSVYKDEDDEDDDADVPDKPPLGEGLNKPAVVTLENMFPRQNASAEARKKYPEKLRSFCDRRNAIFISYDAIGGIFVFSVEHFSRYGFADSEDEEEEEQEQQQTGAGEHKKSDKLEGANKKKQQQLPQQVLGQKRTSPTASSVTADADWRRKTPASEQEEGFSSVADPTSSFVSANQRMRDILLNAQHKQRQKQQEAGNDEHVTAAFEENAGRTSSNSGNNNGKFSLLNRLGDSSSTAESGAAGANKTAQEASHTARDEPSSSSSLDTAVFAQDKNSKRIFTAQESPCLRILQRVLDKHNPKKNTAFSSSSSSTTMGGGGSGTGTCNLTEVTISAAMAKNKPRPNRMTNHALSMGRSFRVGWSPTGQIVHPGKMVFLSEKKGRDKDGGWAEHEEGVELAVRDRTTYHRVVVEQVDPLRWAKTHFGHHRGGDSRTVFYQRALDALFCSFQCVPPEQGTVAEGAVTTPHWRAPTALISAVPSEHAEYTAFRQMLSRCIKTYQEMITASPSSPSGPHPDWLVCKTLELIHASCGQESNKFDNLVIDTVAAMHPLELQRIVCEDLMPMFEGDNSYPACGAVAAVTNAGVHDDDSAAGRLPVAFTSSSWERRRVSLSNWLQSLVNPEVPAPCPEDLILAASEEQQHAAYKRIFDLLTVRCIEPAVSVAESAGLYRLALLISQVDGDASLCELMHNQVTVWAGSGALAVIPTDLVRIYRLMGDWVVNAADRPDAYGGSSVVADSYVDAGASDLSVSILSGMGWRRAVGALFWYSGQGSVLHMPHNLLSVADGEDSNSSNSSSISNNAENATRGPMCQALSEYRDGRRNGCQVDEPAMRYSMSFAPPSAASLDPLGACVELPAVRDGLYNVMSLLFQDKRSRGEGGASVEEEEEQSNIHSFSQLLRDAVRPEGFTRDALDSRASYLLVVFLESIGVLRSCSTTTTNNNNNNNGSSTSTSSVVPIIVRQQLIFQLLTVGLWHWAVFVALQIPDVDARNNMVRELLLRHACAGRSSSDDSEITDTDWDSAEIDRPFGASSRLTDDEAARNRILIDMFQVPESWLHESAAYRLLATGRGDFSVFSQSTAKKIRYHLYRAGQLDEQHRAELWTNAVRIVCQNLVPSAMLNGAADCKYVLAVLDSMETVIDPSSSSLSASGKRMDTYVDVGSVFLDYFRWKEAVEGLSSDIADPSSSDTVEADEGEMQLSAADIVDIAEGELLTTANDLLHRLTVLRMGPLYSTCTPGQNVHMAVLYDMGSYLYKYITRIEARRDEDIDDEDEGAGQMLAGMRTAQGREEMLRNAPVLVETRLDRMHLLATAMHMSNSTGAASVF